MSLLYAGQQVTVYIGFFLVIAGLLGNGINLCLFSTIGTYRRTPCTFYFLVSSVHNIAYIGINLLSRIVSVGYGVDWTRTSSAWCKLRQFSLFTVSLITITCSCLATLDQFFSSSSRASIRRLSNLKWTHRIVLIVVVIWSCHGIPILILYDISPTTRTCVTSNPIFNAYVPIYLLGLICLLPVLVMTIFGYLTYRNLHGSQTLARQYADRQLVRMTLLQVLLVAISFVPYGLFSTYSLVTSSMTKEADRLEKEYFMLTVISLAPYLYYAGSCYVFLISSSRFRRAVINRLLVWKRDNTVAPLDDATRTRPAQTIER